MSFSLKMFNYIFPQIAATKVYDAMSTPKSRMLKKFEENALDLAEGVSINFKNYKIQTYSWGIENTKTVLLIHGWEGHAGNFGALIEILLNKGYKVISFDAPSHGKSSPGKTNMFEFADCSSAMMKRFKPSFVISHSYGSVSTIVSMTENQDVIIEKWLMISKRARKKLVQIVERDAKVKITTLNMKHYGKLIPNVKEAIIIHSQVDIVLPIDQARRANLAIPNSKLIEIEKAGHFNILWSSKLKELVNEHL